jgi:4-amino-4-deoxy-L-arabinose transferase-like glycosyltransferase
VLSRAVDHPAYPLSIAAFHRLIGRPDPSSWQFAAQLASVTFGVLLVIPLYLVTLEIFGATAAWMACVLTFVVPIPGHVMADALSESTFLHFWLWGLWFALRFLRCGHPIWLPAVLGASGLAYMTRPEGVLLPAALVGTLGVVPLLPSLRMNWTRWWIAVGLLAIGPVVVAAPFIALRGGIGTKPAVARLFGLAPKAPGMAVERDRPVDENQSAVVTFGLAVRAMAHAVAEASTPPMLLLAPFGIIAFRGRGNRRQLLLMGSIVAGWVLALIRLHATGGYCTPRHALIAALPIIGAGGAGIARLIESGTDWLERSGRVAIESRRRIERFAPVVVLGGLVAWWLPSTLAPLNRGYLGYRQAGEWLAAQTDPNARVFDLKGWAIFYSEHPGYSFARIAEGTEDRGVRWLVAHDSLLNGPWFYCDIVRNMVQGRRPVASFPARPERGIARVHVFDLAPTSGVSPSEVASKPRVGHETR